MGRLSEQMDCLTPVKVILQDIEECQMFFLSNTTVDRTLKDVQMITYELIKLAATGLYAKAIEQWNTLNPTYQSAWTQFRTFIIA